MVKNFRKFIIYAFTVWLTKLLYDVIMKLLPVVKSTKNPYFDVLIGMSLTLIIFYPLYGLTHNWMEKFSGHYIKHAKKIHRNNFLALLIAFVLGFIVLFCCFMLLKFNINVVMEIVNWVKG